MANGVATSKDGLLCGHLPFRIAIRVSLERLWIMGRPVGVLEGRNWYGAFLALRAVEGQLRARGTSPPRESEPFEPSEPRGARVIARSNISVVSANEHERLSAVHRYD